MPPTTRSTLAFFAVCTLAAVIKFSYAAEYEAREPLSLTPYGDSVVYLDEALRLSESTGPLGDFAYYKPPLYTWLLSALGAYDPSTWPLLRRLQAVLGVASVALVFLLALRLHGLGAAILSCLLLALYAPFTFAESKILDTTLGLSLMLGALALIPTQDIADLKPGRALAAGLCLGIASLARPVNLLLLTALVVMLAAKRRQVASTSLLVGAALAILPVTLHNKSISGDYILINYSGGHTFWTGNNENARGMYAPPPGFPEGVLNERSYEQQLAAQALGRPASPAEQRNYSYRQGLKFLLENSIRLPMLGLNKLRFAVSNYEVSDNYLLPRERRKGLLRVCIVPFAALLALAVAAHLSSSRRRAWLPSLGVCAAFVVLLVVYTTSRYRLPATPFLAITAGASVTVIRGATWSQRARFALVASIVFGISLFMPLPESKEDLRQSENYFDTMLDLHATELLLRQQRTLEAADSFAEAIHRTEDDSSLLQLEQTLLSALPPDQRAEFSAALEEALHHLVNS